MRFDLPHREDKQPGKPVRVERFYDRMVRTWTAYGVDQHDNQVTETQHAHRKEWLSLDVSQYEVYSWLDFQS